MLLYSVGIRDVERNPERKQCVSVVCAICIAILHPKNTVPFAFVSGMKSGCKIELNIYFCVFFFWNCTVFEHIIWSPPSHRIIRSNSNEIFGTTMEMVMFFFFISNKLTKMYFFDCLLLCIKSENWNSKERKLDSNYQCKSSGSSLPEEPSQIDTFSDNQFHRVLCSLGKYLNIFIVSTFFCMQHNQIFRIKKNVFICNMLFSFPNSSRLPAAISTNFFLFFLRQKNGEKFEWKREKNWGKKENKKRFSAYSTQMKPFHGSFYIHFFFELMMMIICHFCFDEVESLSKRP